MENAPQRSPAWPGATSNPSSFEVVYRGYKQRTRRHMVAFLPASVWGSRSYGLGGGGDDFSFKSTPVIGETVTVTLDDRTTMRIFRQRDLRTCHRRRGAPY